MASGRVDPFRFPRIWDAIVVSEVASPGLAKFSGKPSRKYKWDVKGGKGADGEYGTYVGKGLASFTVSFLFWEQGQLDEWEEFRTLLKYDPTKKTKQALDIYHPALADIDISSVVTDEITAVLPVTDPPDGRYSCEVTFLEFRPPPKQAAVSTPDGASTGDPKKPGVKTDPAIAALDKTLADELAKAKALGPL